MKLLLDSFNFAAGVVGIGGMFRLGWLLVDYLWFLRSRRACKSVQPSFIQKERQAPNRWKEMEKLVRQRSKFPLSGQNPPPPQGPPEKPQPTGGRLIRSDRDPGSPKS